MSSHIVHKAGGRILFLTGDIKMIFKKDKKTNVALIFISPSKAGIYAEVAFDFFTDPQCDMNMKKKV